MDVHTSFESLTATEFEAYAKQLVENSKTTGKKREALSYLWSVCSADKKKIDQQLKNAKQDQYTQKQRQDVVQNEIIDHEFDFSLSPELFTQQSLTDATLENLLQTDNSIIYMKNKSYTGDLVVSANNVIVDGQGSGEALSELSNSANVNGNLVIQSENVHIKNINFISRTNQCVIVNGAKNVTLSNCSFQPGSGLSDTKWFYGAGLQSGNLKIENCKVENFSSWYLMDASTTSAAAQVRLDNVEIINNYFSENQGSIAIRGPESDPNQYIKVHGNKFETAVFHQYFWDFVEISGAFLQADIQDNVCIGEAGTNNAAGKKGGFQLWSKSPRPFTIKFKGNTSKNLKIFLKIAHNDGFYSPNVYDINNHLLDLSASITDTAFAYSPVYKNNDGTTQSENKWQEGDYTPENISAYPNPPLVVNPHNYNIVQPN